MRELALKRHQKSEFKGPYLVERVLTLKGVVQQTAVNDGDQRMTLYVACKGKVSVRLLDVPFLLELGGCLSVVCE